MPNTTKIGGSGQGESQFGPWGPIQNSSLPPLAEQQYWEIPAFADTSTYGFRPGTIPRLADHLVIDEWSYKIAINTYCAVLWENRHFSGRHVSNYGTTRRALWPKNAGFAQIIEAVRASFLMQPGGIRRRPGVSFDHGCERAD